MVNGPSMTSKKGFWSPLCFSGCFVQPAKSVLLTDSNFSNQQFKSRDFVWEVKFIFYFFIYCLPSVLNHLNVYRSKIKGKHCLIQPSSVDALNKREMISSSCKQKVSLLLLPVD